MKAKRFAKHAVSALSVLLVFGTSLCVASEMEPIEYQASVDLDAMLSEAQPAETAKLLTKAHFADPTSASDVRAGLQIYKVHCSSCHGRQLQGQALWQVQDAYAGLRAPAHDDTGHTWQHSDEELFRKVRTGHIGQWPQGTESPGNTERHAFAAVLSDEKILQVIAFIKARWSLGIKVAQSTLNPQFQGMPKDADTVEWTFPPTCLSAK